MIRFKLVLCVKFFTCFIFPYAVAVVALNYTCTSSVSVYEGSPVTICAILTFINGSKVLPISVGVLFNETNGTAVSKLYLQLTINNKSLV